MDLEGVNKTIFNWTKNSKIIKKIYDNNAIFEADLKKALGDVPDERYTPSIKLSEHAWGKYPVLGVCPNFTLLSEAEYKGIFHVGYRDHTTHSFKVYLTGLWIYEKNDKIHQNFDALGITEDRFICTWTATALWHDVGYLFENDEIAKRNDWWEYIKQEITAQYVSPLSKIIGDNVLSAAVEQAFYVETDIRSPSLTTIPLVEQDRDAFNYLNAAGNMSGLSFRSKETPIESLYNYIKSDCQKNGIRQPYRDHGIFGALLLIHLWKKYYLSLLSKVVKNLSVSSKLSPLAITQITNLFKETTRAEPVIVEAAQAIALHNITKTDWHSAELIDSNVNIENFGICGNSHASYTAQPFAFLLKLADELQMWDRPNFDNPGSNELTLRGKDMDIDVTADSIGIWLRGDDDSYKKLEHPNTEYSKLKKKLASCVQAGTLLKPLRASQAPSQAPVLTGISSARKELVFIFHNDATRELITQINDKYQCNVRVVLYNRTGKYFEFLQPDGNCGDIQDSKTLFFADENFFKKKTSVIFKNDHDKTTGLVLISTDVGPIGFLVLEGMVVNTPEELIGDRDETSRLNDYGVMYGALVLKQFQKLVAREGVLGKLVKADNLRCEINRYLPFGYNDCITVFLDIRGLSKLLLDDKKTRRQRSLQFINNFSNSVQKISEQHFGIISSHFGGGMLIIFNQVFQEELPLACFRATCAMHKIRNSFNSIAKETFGEEEANKIMNLIGIGMGADAGEIFFSTFGHNNCVYYTGVGEKISFAKKIENVSGRENVAVEHIHPTESASNIDGDSPSEKDVSTEDTGPSCKNKIFVSEFVYNHCKDVQDRMQLEIESKPVKNWAKLKPIKVRMNYDNESSILYYMGHTNKKDCPFLDKKDKCLCCL